MNRYYSSGLGRFLSPDPYRASGGPATPQSWNKLAYVQNDPVNFTDHRGLWIDPGDPGYCDPDEDTWCDGGGGSGGEGEGEGEPLPFTCGYVPQIGSPVPGRFQDITTESGQAFGFGDPIFLTFSASGGTGNYTFHVSQTFTVLGAITYNLLGTVNQTSPSKPDAIFNAESIQTGNVLVFEDLPGIFYSPDPGIYVQSANLVKSFVTTVTVSDGGAPIPCGTIRWYAWFSWPKIGQATGSAVITGTSAQ